jgi:hypothetical protein
MNRSFVALAVIACALTVASTASGQGFIAGHREYPQFRNASGLPGGMHGVAPGGYARFSGAMAISTPVGYSFLRGQRYIGICNLSDNKRIELASLSGEGVKGSNTTGYLLGGITFPYGRF